MKDDQVYLNHMLDAIMQIEVYSAGVSFLRDIYLLTGMSCFS